MLAEENIEDYVQVPSVAGGDEGEYVLQVSGESMRDAGILDGRLRRGAPAGHAPSDGDIVVALLGDEATVKRFFRESDHVRLQPENPSMEPIRSRDVAGAGPGRGSLQEGLMPALADTPVIDRRRPRPERLFDPGGRTLDDRAARDRRRAPARPARCLPGLRRDDASAASSSTPAECTACGSTLE